MRTANLSIPMRLPARHGLPQGFTLIEMMVVLTLIALLLTLAVPRYYSALDNARLNVQRQNIATIRDAIDKFYGDKGKYPDSLDELVARRYLRNVPVDPVTESVSWVLIAPQDNEPGAVYDVKAATPLVAQAPAGGSE